MNAKSEIVQAELNQFPVEPEEFKTLSNENKDKEYEKLYAEHYAAEACVEGMTRDPDYERWLDMQNNQLVN